MPSPTKPFFVDTVTRIPAYWANNVTDLIFDVFELANTKAGVRAALQLGTLSLQNADGVQIVGGSINNVPIGISVPMQGRFTVLSIESDPIHPVHGVNLRTLNQRLNALSSLYLPLIGGTMTGPLVLYGDPIQPLEAVPRRWVDARLQAVILPQPLQRYHVVSVGQNVFSWPTFQWPVTVHPSNFVVFVDGQYQTFNLHYTVDLSGPMPTFNFGSSVAPARDFDVVYHNNLDNLLLANAPVAPPPPGIVAGPGWSDPINMRINYALTNAGQNQISASHTVLRDMYVGCVITSGSLGSRVVTWQSQWFPASPSATLHPPQLITVSPTEARLALPDAVSDHYWEGRLELTMLLDGVVTGQVLWMDMNNQTTPEYRDGLVRWGFVGPVAPPPGPTANLSVTKTVTTPSSGGTHQYNVTVSNAGPSAADGAVLTDLFPAGWQTNSIVTSATGGASWGSTPPTLLSPQPWVIPTLPVGGTAVIRFIGQFLSPGSKTNIATVAVPAGTTEVDPLDNSAQVTVVIAPPPITPIPTIFSVEDNSGDPPTPPPPPQV